jgi:hypothetical protein
VRVRARRDARQGGRDLSLAAGAEVEDLVGREVARLVVVHERRDVGEQPHRLRRRSHAVHGAAEQADAPVDAIAARITLSIRATLEAKQPTATLPLSEPISSIRRRDAELGAGGALDETLVLSQVMASTPSSPRPAQLGVVGRRADQRVGIDLPVAGVQDGAQRRLDRQPVRLRDGVRDGHELDPERPELQIAAQRDLGQADLIEDAGVAQLLADQEGGERRGVERGFQARPQPAERTDVVLVSVRQHDAQDVVGVGLDVARVRGDHLHAGRRQVAEGHAQVDHDPLPIVRRPVAVQIEIHPDLVRPAQRQEDELVSRLLLQYSVQGTEDDGSRQPSEKNRS